jgi:hypothetical protein
MTMNRKYPERRFGACAAFLVATLMLYGTALSAGSADKPQEGSIVGRVFLDENADTVFRECDCDCGLDDIPVRLYRDHCGGLIIQTARTDKEGYFHFHGLEAGVYCLMPMPKLICEGYQPTKSITQKVQVKPGETVEAEWFGFDHFFDLNE